MSKAENSSHIVRTALFSIWGLVTLILVFTVSLLMYEMYEQGQTPLAMTLGSDGAAQHVSSSSSPVETSYEVDIYFASKSMSIVSAETHRLDLGGSTVENCRAAMTHLIDGPNLPTLAPIVSNKTRIRGMYLMENGELVVDFSRDLEAGHIKSASAEMLMVDGIVSTLFQPILKGAQDLPVKSIRFLFEGSPYQQSFPAHIDLSDPVRPKPKELALAETPVDDA